MRTKAVQFLMAFVAAACLFAGCVDNDKSLTIVFAAPPEKDCSYKAQGSGDYTYVPYGVLDLAHPAHGGEPVYFLYPQVHNNLGAGLDMDAWELESYAIQMESASITYEWLRGREEVLEDPNQADLAPLLMLENDVENTWFISAVVEPAGASGEPGKIVTVVEIIPPDVGSLLTIVQNLSSSNLSKLTLGAHVRIEGETLGGRQVESNDFIFPVRFCWGCLGTAVCTDELGNFLRYPACNPGQDANNFECD